MLQGAGVAAIEHFLRAVAECEAELSIIIDGLRTSTCDKLQAKTAVREHEMYLWAIIGRDL